MSYDHLNFTIGFELDGVQCNTLAVQSNEVVEEQLETLREIDAVEDPEVLQIE